MEENSAFIKHTHFIVNPGAGTRSSDKVLKAILARFPAAGNRIHLTAYHGHATQIAAEALASGAECIVVAGGDGTINEVLKIIVDTQVVLGILPAGSGNGFARHLGIRNRFDHLDRIASGIIHPHSVDVMKVNDRYSINVAGFGFDARIAHLSAKRTSRGILMYIRLILRELVRYEPVQFRYEVDGRCFDRKAFVLSIANSNQYGNGAYIAPKASITDGIITICGISRLRFFTFIPEMIRVLTGNITRSGRYFAEDGQRVTIRRDGRFEAHLDGEPVFFEQEVKIEVMPAAVRILG